MTIEETIKEQLPLLSAEDSSGPGLATVIASGRRRRRNRRIAVGLGTTGVVAVIAATALAVAAGRAGEPQPAGGRAQHGVQPAGPVPHHAPDGQVEPPKGGGQAQDQVTGTRVDEQILAALAPNLPDGLQTRDVYPSDWTRNTSLPDAQAANATDWEAYFDTAGSDTVRVVIGLPAPGEPTGIGCGGGTNNCTQQTLADGSTLVVEEYTVGNVYYRSAALLRSDTKTVVASDLVTAASVAEARRAWTLDADQLTALSTSAGLDFPDPIDPPVVR